MEMESHAASNLRQASLGTLTYAIVTCHHLQPLALHPGRGCAHLAKVRDLKFLQRTQAHTPHPSLRMGGAQLRSEFNQQPDNWPSTAR